MQLLAGSHVLARYADSCTRHAAVNPWCCPAAAHRPGTNSCRQRSPYRLHVSCPAVEQDTEVPSTSGRPFSDGELISTLLGQEQAAVMEVLEEQQLLEEHRQLKQRIKNSGSLPLLCELIQAEAYQFDHRLTSHALHRLSVLCHAFFTQLQSAHLTSQEAQQAAWVTYVDPALKTLGQLLLQHMDSADTWTVSIAIWAYGHLQWSEETVMTALCSRGGQLLHSFNPTDCAAAFVGLAKLTGTRCRTEREFIEALVVHTRDLLSHVEEWSKREVVSIVWSLSHLGAAGPLRRPLIQALVEMTVWRLQDFGVKEIVITIHSLGRLHMRLPAQMVKLTNQLLKRLDSLNSQDAANLVYSCAKVQFKQPELLQKLPHAVLSKLSSFKPMEVSTLLYGYGQLHYLHMPLLDTVAKACAPRLHEFSTQDLCVTVWSYGAVGYCPADTTLFDAACRVLLQRKERLLPLQITMLVKGFSRAGYQPPAGFMQQMAQLALAKLSQFSPLEYSQLLWGYAAAGYRDVQLFEAVVARTIQQLHSRSHEVTKTTVDTMLVACRGVGFWPQLLVETAEINGLYVKTRQADEQMQPLLAAASIEAAGAAAAAAGAAAVQAAAEADTAAVTAEEAAAQQHWGAVDKQSAAAGEQAETTSHTAAAAAASLSSSLDSSHAIEAQEGAAVLAAAEPLGDAQAHHQAQQQQAAVQQDQEQQLLPLLLPQQQQQQQHLTQLLSQQQEGPSQQPPHLSSQLQRPHPPQQRWRQHKQQLPLPLLALPQQQQRHWGLEQQQQSNSRQRIDSPLLRAHLRPPPLMPHRQLQQQQQRLAAAYVAAVAANATGSSSSSSSSSIQSEHIVHDMGISMAVARGTEGSDGIVEHHGTIDVLAGPPGQHL